MLLLLGSHNTDRDDTLELLFGKQVFPVLVLALELVISALNGSLLLLKLPDFFLKDFHFLSLLHPASDSTFPVLQSSITKIRSNLISNQILKQQFARKNGL